MLLKEKKGFFLSEYTIGVILLLVVAMIVIKLCSDTIDLKTENNPAVRSKNAVRGLADAIVELEEKCDVPIEASPQSHATFGYQGDPKSLPITNDAHFIKFLEYYDEHPNKLDNVPCVVRIPFSFDFNNWYFSINSRPSPANPSESVIVISYYEKIPDGFSLDWTSGSIPVGNTVSVGVGGGGVSSDGMLVYLPSGNNIDNIFLIKIKDMTDSGKIKLLIYQTHETPEGQRGDIYTV